MKKWLIIVLMGIFGKSSQAQLAKTGGYAFTTTNFDDGWTSTVKEDWVEVVKGNITVLIHYPRQGTIFPADPDPLTRAAWDILVAPRYTSLSNFKVVSPNDYNRSYMGCGNVVDARGHPVYVALFRGGGGWMEFIAPDKASFVNEFNVDADKISWNTSGNIFGSMAKMANYNKFAVAATDLAGSGKWSDHYSSSTFYVNYYTGRSEGMSTYSSNQYFLFGAGQSYKWDLIAVNWHAGRSEVGNGKGAGTFQSVNNWQLAFSDMEGKPKTYDVYFSAIKGGRVLFMNDAKYPGSGVFTGFSKE
jgi:hypothetical protein